MQWKVNSGSLIKQILDNPGTSVMVTPLNIFKNLLGQVGKEAARINDPKLNALMCRLAIYSISDPYDADFDADLTRSIIEQAQ